MDLQNLKPAVLVWQSNFDMHLQSTGPVTSKKNAKRSYSPSWTQERLIEEVFSIGHANQKDIVQSIDAIDLRQELIHQGIVHS